MGQQQRDERAAKSRERVANIRRLSAHELQIIIVQSTHQWSARHQIPQDVDQDARPLSHDRLPWVATMRNQRHAKREIDRETQRYAHATQKYQN